MSSYSLHGNWNSISNIVDISPLRSETVQTKQNLLTVRKLLQLGLLFGQHAQQKMDTVRIFNN